VDGNEFENSETGFGGPQFLFKYPDEHGLAFHSSDWFAALVSCLDLVGNPKK
jgi:hypothetical protein